MKEIIKRIIEVETKKMDEVGSSIFKIIFILGQMKIKIDSMIFVGAKKD